MTSFHVKAKYLDDDVYLSLGRYIDHSIAIRLNLALTGEALAVATVCLKEYGETPATGNVFIKAWEENEGMLTGLQEAGIVGDVVREIPAGYATAYEVPLLISPDDSRCKLL